MSIKGIIFDFDGLILDTEMPLYTAWEEIFQEHRCSLPLALFAGSLGSTPGLFNAIEYLEKVTGVNLDRESITSRQDKRALEIIQNEPVMPGVLDYLASGRELGLKLAVASSSESWWVLGHLERLGLLHSFDTICTSDDVTHVKPAPDLFLCALERLEIKAEEAVVFEDSLNGIRAARAAGCYAVAVPNQLTRLVDLSPANLLIHSMEEIPLKELITRFNGKDPSGTPDPTIDRREK